MSEKNKPIKLNSLLKPMGDPLEGIENGDIKLDLVCKRGSGFTHKRLNLAMLQDRIENYFRGMKTTKAA